MSKYARAVAQLLQNDESLTELNLVWEQISDIRALGPTLVTNANINTLAAGLAANTSLTIL